MSRIVAVSNRVGPVRSAAVAGGLAVALVEALRETRGMWFGWSGQTYEGTVGDGRGELHQETIGGLALSTVDLPQEEYERYYNGYANRCLWPLLHFRIDLMDYQRENHHAYSQINQEFARRLLPMLRPDDLVWVHDYHLFPLGAELRSLGARQRIGFFLHTPFPPADIFATLPGHEALLEALFSYDVIGFQTEQDVQRFSACVERVAHGSMEAHGDSRSACAYGRKMVVRAFPIGIDAAQFRKLACSVDGETQRLRMREALRERELIIGVDRLDYSKGLLRRVEAYGRMLDRYPDAHRRIELLQIAPISRGELKAYRDFRREIESAATLINERYAQADWTPVRYLNRAMMRKSLAGLYRVSRIGLVTPMRDGMNLVAKEYVAAQDPDDPGVLILSKFAGAAQQMHQALQINPYDVDEMADAMQAARIMPLDERKLRYAELMRGLNSEGIRQWRDCFIGTLNGGPTETVSGSEPDVLSAQFRLNCDVALASKTM